jgi:hypothetical protein
MYQNSRTYVLSVAALLFIGGALMLASVGCGNSYGTPYSYSNLVPNDGAIVIKMINTTSISGGLHSPKSLAPDRATATSITTTTSNAAASGTLIKIRPDDVYVSISDMSIYSTDGKEYVLFTEPKEINLLNLIKDGEVVAMASDVPVGSYNRMKFNINYMRILYEGEKQRIALDQTVYLSTSDANLTQFALQSSTRASVKLNFDINDKVFKDRNGNYQVFPSLFLIYDGSEAIKQYN